MKKLLLLSALVLTLVSCNPTKHAIVTYNHVTGEVRINDSLQHPRHVGIVDYTDDEFAVRMVGQKVKKVEPVLFPFEYDVIYRVDRAYFYSPFMSNYMQDNEWFIFDITYKRDLNP